MGLDNGIVLKIDEFPKDFYTEKSDFGTSSYDEKAKELNIAYWRKCWGIREAILNIVGRNNLDEFEYKIEWDDVPAIIRALKNFLNEKYWNDSADSIWEYEEYIDTMIDIILNLKWLEKYLKDHKDAECYFYDSY